MADQTNEIDKLATKLKDALGSTTYDGGTGEQTPESAKWEKVWNAASGNARRLRGEALDKIAQDIAQKIAQRGNAPMSDDDMTEIVKTAYEAAAPQPNPDAKVDVIRVESLARMEPETTPETDIKADTAMTAKNNAPKPEGQKPENWSEEQIDATWNALTRGGSYTRQGYTPPEVKNTLPVLADQQPEATPEAERTATANLPAVIAAQPAPEADEEIPAAPLDGVPAVDPTSPTDGFSPEQMRLYEALMDITSDPEKWIGVSQAIGMDGMDSITRPDLLAAAIVSQVGADPDTAFAIEAGVDNEGHFNPAILRNEAVQQAFRRGIHDYLTDIGVSLSGAPVDDNAPLAGDSWEGIGNILYRSESDLDFIESQMAGPDGLRKMTLPMQVLTPAKLAFLAAHFRGLERAPAFLNTIEELAAQAGKTVNEYLSEQATSPEIRAAVMDAFTRTHPLLDRTNKLPFTHFALEENENGDLPVLVFKDAAKNTYRDDGQKTSVRMKFGATMSYDIARNLAKTYISRRMSPTADGSEQTLQFTVDTGRGPLRTAAGLRMKKENYERSVMLLSVLQEAKAVGIRPEITMAGTGPYTRFALEQIALPGEEAGQGAFKLDAKALTEARAQCPEIMELIDSYNRRNQAPTLDGETPENEMVAEPSLDGAEAAEMAGTTAGRRSPTDMLAAAQEAANRSEGHVPTATPAAARSVDDGDLGHIKPNQTDEFRDYLIRTGQNPDHIRVEPRDSEHTQNRQQQTSRHEPVLTPDQRAASDSASATAEERATQGQARSRHVPVLPRPQGM